MPYLNRYIKLAVGLLALIVLMRCQTTSSTVEEEVQFNPLEVPYQKLSAYAFFKGQLTAQQPNTRVVPYSPITPLFTDYAHKARFVWMPDSTKATVDSDGRIIFPNNTVLIKSFYYPSDFREEQENWIVIETRLLFKKEGEWEAYTYIWDEQGKDASLSVVGDIKPINWIDEKGVAKAVDYIIPNKNQCKSCHNRQGALLPIGPKVAHLNGAYSYNDFSTVNQISAWQENQILETGKWHEQFLPTPDWQDDTSYSVADRALAYLEMNCGHCHHPEGSAHTTGLFLTNDYKEKSTQIGICKPPVAAGKGSGGFKYSIVPGKPDSSILLYRMIADDPGVMMPELGRAMAHEEGIELISDWILSLEGECR
jgi:uncharacterized repeat protein (TIGR03806 family)